MFTAYFENDVLSGTDAHDTSGLKFSWLSPDLVAWGQTGWRQSVLERLPFVNRPEGQKNLGLAFGQSLGNVQTYANAGGTVRFGYRLPSDFGVELARGASLGGSPPTTSIRAFLFSINSVFSPSEPSTAARSPGICFSTATRFAPAAR